MKTQRLFPGRTILALVSLCAVAAGQERPADSRLSIQVTSFTPRSVDVSAKEPCVLSFRLNRKATVRLDIADWDGEVVAQLERSCDAGENNIQWDRKFSKLEPTDGVYTFRLEARTADGQHTTYDPGLASGLVNLPLKRLDFDPAQRKINYSMPALGMSRIRLSRENYMLVRTVQDWTPVLAGQKTIVWDGKDQSGHPVSAKGLICRITTYSLPENAFILCGTGKRKPPRPWEQRLAWQANPDLKGRFFHARIPRENSRDPRVTLEFLEQPVDEAGNPPQLSGPAKVRARIHPDDQSYMIDERFEVCVYVDGVFTFEDEDGTSPYTFDLEPKGLNRGSHLLTVMLMSTGDHVGACSAPFVVTESVKNDVKERN